MHISSDKLHTSKFGFCAGATDSAAIVANCGWDDSGDPDANPYRGRVLFKGAGDNRAFMNGIIRSENGHGRITGYQTIDLFLEETDIKITSVNAKSKVGKYQVAPMHVGQKYYIDRDYTVAGLPDFLTGVQVIQTANDDKHESADDFLCFKISSPATIWITAISMTRSFWGSSPVVSTSTTARGVSNQFPEGFMSGPIGVVRSGGWTRVVRNGSGRRPRGYFISRAS